MHFPPGPAIFLVVLFMFAGLVGILTQSATTTDADLVVWTFDPTHRATYQQPTAQHPALTDLHTSRTGHSVAVEVMPSRALDARLLSILLANEKGAVVPDLVEIEIGSVGKYLRPTAGESGLLPLDGYLARADAGLAPARLAAWTRSGELLGIPRDVHPVSLTYRYDLFEQAGIDLSTCNTWPEFHRACLQFQQYWREHGREIKAIQLARWNTAELLVMLHQQRLALISANGRPQICSLAIARTIAFYCRLVSGPDAIAEQVADSAVAQSLGDGGTGALLTPDWRVGRLRWNPDLLGRLRMMPLPRFTSGDAPTASWGGTVIAIPRHVRNPDASWELLRSLHLTPEALEARAYHSDVLPAVSGAWEQPQWHLPNPLYGDQPIGTLYAQLARDLPDQAVSPYSLLMAQSVAGVLAAAQEHLERSGGADLEAFCLDRLTVAQARLDRLIEFAEGAP